MDVRRCEETPVDVAAWEAYVAGHPHSTSDHQWGWRRILERAFGFTPHYLAAIEAEHVVGVLPLFRIPRGWKSRAFSSIPFGNYGGICADTPEAAEALLQEAKRIVREAGARYLDLRHQAPMADEELQLQSLYHRFSMPFPSDPDQHLKALGANNRKKLSRTRRLGYRVAASRDVEALYAIHLHTTRRLGTPCFPRRYFEGVLEEFGERAEIHFVRSGRTPVGYNLVLYFKDTMVVQFGGTLTSHLRTYTNHLLYWHCIEQGLARGLRVLDYCRNRADSGSAQFKRSLHLTERPLAYQYYLPAGQTLPSRNPSNPKYQMAIRIWQRLPTAVTARLGPPLVRYLA